MAEPIGFLGTAVGVVSLGIQVYGSLKVYFDNFKSRDEIVGKSMVHLKCFGQSLDIIQASMPYLKDEHPLPSAVVTSCLESCQLELRILHDELLSHESTAPTDLKGKMKEVKKKFVFPFHQPRLDKLESTLERITGNLSIAIDGLGLNTMSVMNTKIADLGSVVHSTTSTLVNLDTKSNSLHDAQMRVETNLADISSTFGAKLGALQTAQDRNMARLAHLQTRIGPVPHSIENLSSQFASSVSGIDKQIHSSYFDTVMRLGIMQSFNERQAERRDRQLQAIENMLQALVSRATSNDKDTLGQNLTRMLISKPALLRDTCEATNHDVVLSGSRTVSQSYGGNQQVILNKKYSRGPRDNTLCGCRCRHLATRRSSKWPIISVFYETITETTHEPSCPSAQFEVAKKRHTICVTYTGLRRFISRAMSISLQMNQGAGGFSIGPMFRYFAMVDSETSPAFCIVKTLINALRGIGIKNSKSVNDSEDYEDYGKVLNHGISKLRRIYQRGHASPTDVNAEGETLIQASLCESPAILASALGLPGLSALFDLLVALIGMDIPCETPAECASGSVIDYCLEFPRGSSNRYIRISDEHRTYITGKLAHLFLVQAPSLASRELSDGFDVVIFGEYACESEDTAEALDLDGPIFQALLQRKEDNLRQILQDTPTTQIQTRNAYDIAPIHTAIGWPMGLRLLLQNMSGLDAEIEYRERSPLIIAMQYSGMSCRNGRANPVCDECDCAESVRILLEAGCRLNHDTVQEILGGVYSSMRAILVMLSHIKEWRRKLLSLQLHYIPGAIQHYNSPVLDSRAREAVSALEERGISPSKLFGLHPDDYRLGDRTLKSIYHMIKDTFYAEVAFDLGFHDIDADSNGQTPLMTQRPGLVPKNGHLLLDIEYCEWLIDHGATYTKHVPYETCHRMPASFNRSILPQRTIAHEFLTEQGIYVPMDLSIDWLCLLGRLPIGDGCVCGCSGFSQGCYPLTAYLNGLLRTNWATKSREDRVTWICDNVADLIIRDGECTLLAEIIIRALTFHFLDLRHTCCTTLDDWICIDEGFSPRSDLDILEHHGEDHCEIWDEDEDLLNKLEDLVAEFIFHFSQDALSLSAFIQGYWTMRMSQVKQDIDKRVLTPEEKGSIMSIGIVLENEDSRDPCLERTKDLVHLGTSYVETWTRRLDDIWYEN
ncbi:hypothetical protein F4779DRAFT_547263 [Xylariaceae sp. FL0662B]|nr:hypothetical protein F4779DRAFT_547263 [Xylariaceae sp. FL0662B]